MGTLGAFIGGALEEALGSFIERTVEKAIMRFLEYSSVKSEEDVVWLTPDQVSKRLSVTRSTLWKWDKEGYLRVHKFGKRARYKESEVARVESAERKGGVK